MALSMLVTFVIQRPFSALNLSHASFSVLKTAPAIILCSVVAVVGICQTMTVSTRSSLHQGLYPLTLSGCTFAIPFIYCILTLFGSTSSAIPIFFHSASGHNTISRLLSSARRLSALPPFHIANLASTESASANFSSSAFSAAAFAARSRLTAASELAEEETARLPDRSSITERLEADGGFLDCGALALVVRGFAAFSARIRP